MRSTREYGISGLAIVVATGMCSQTALAVCAGSFSTSGSGLPSLSATESSTNQALELVERRRKETTEGALMTTAVEAPAAEPAPAADAAPAPKAKSTTSSGGSAPKKKVAKAPAASSSDQSEAPPPSGYASSSQTSGGWTRGAWVSGFVDYDRDRDVNIGVRSTQPNAGLNNTPSEEDTNVERRTRSGGVLAGMDWSNLKSGALRGYQIGAFGGFNSSESKYTDGTFSIFEIDPGSASGSGQEEQFRRTGAKDESESGTIGGYGIFFKDRWTVDLTLKADIGQLDAEQTLSKLNCGTIRQVAGQADFTDYTVAANIHYRFDLTPQTWWEPLAGFRYTLTDYSDQSGTMSLGESDGHLLRLQAGARVTTAWVSQTGLIWVTSLTGMLYSDVLHEGYFGKTGIDDDSDGFTDRLVDSAELNDEGKVRVMNQISTSLTLAKGVSLLGEVETRYGDEYFGVTGRLGGRYEW